MTDIDVLIIGAGPAGAVSSAYLNKMGYKVQVLEKTVFPRFVIGESLLPHCMDHLDAVGFLPNIKKHGFQLKNGAAFYKGDRRLEFMFSDQHTQGWSWTWQVKRANFDQILINSAQEQGVPVKFNCTVTAVNCTKDVQTVTYTDGDGISHTVTSRFLIDASGYGRVLPQLFDLDAEVSTIPRGAVFCHIHDTKRTSQAGENIFIHSFRQNQAWIWAIPFSDRTTSVGVVSDVEYVKSLHADGGKGFLEHIRTFPDLKGRFSEEELVFEPREILSYAKGVKQLYGEGYVMCGNATEFLDPIFSSGVTLATGSGYNAALLVHKHLQGETVDWQGSYEDVVRRGVDVFRSFVLNWYNGNLQTIFFAKDIEPAIKKQICSVLAGYVWDETNPIIKKHKTILQTLADYIKLTEAQN